MYIVCTDDCLPFSDVPTHSLSTLSNLSNLCPGLKIKFYNENVTHRSSVYWFSVSRRLLIAFLELELDYLIFQTCWPALQGRLFLWDWHFICLTFLLNYAMYNGIKKVVMVVDTLHPQVRMPSLTNTGPYSPRMSLYSVDKYRKKYHLTILVISYRTQFL